MNEKNPNLQVIFTRVKDHLLAQGRTAKNGDSCAYRGQDGLKCAAGALILDREYSQSLETKTVAHVDVAIALARSGALTEPITINPLDPGIINYKEGSELHLLRRLQSIHDNEFNGGPERWPNRLQELASDFGLDYHYKLPEAPAEI